MASFPNRCQHLKVNGTQCGSPALRRNKFCYFHKRHHEEQIELNTDVLKNDRKKNARARSRKAAIDLPVLEDANSIQVSLMQIMRLLVAGQIDPKTAGLLLYALQTASINVKRTNFEPYMHEVILNPAEVGETVLGENIWEDSDFEEEEEDEEESDDEVEESEDNEAVAAPPAKARIPIPKHPTGKVDWAELRQRVNATIESATTKTAAIKTAAPAILAAQPARQNPVQSGKDQGT